MSKPKWIRGKALITAKALRLFQPGDELWCSACEKAHIFQGWEGSNGAFRIEGNLMFIEDVAKWRPKQ